jgi:hypothetical protein
MKTTSEIEQAARDVQSAEAALDAARRRHADALADQAPPKAMRRRLRLLPRKGPYMASERRSLPGRKLACQVAGNRPRRSRHALYLGISGARTPGAREGRRASHKRLNSLWICLLVLLISTQRLDYLSTSRPRTSNRLRTECLPRKPTARVRDRKIKAP